MTPTTSESEGWPEKGFWEICPPLSRSVYQRRCNWKLWTSDGRPELNQESQTDQKS